MERGALNTTYVSANGLTAQVPASDLTTSGTAQVTVVNPGSNGGTSNSQTFKIQGFTPILNSVSPSSATAGSTAITITLTGSRFDGAAQVVAVNCERLV